MSLSTYVTSVTLSLHGSYERRSNYEVRCNLFRLPNAAIHQQQKLNRHDRGNGTMLVAPEEQRQSESSDIPCPPLEMHCRVGPLRYLMLADVSCGKQSEPRAGRWLKVCKTISTFLSLLSSFTSCEEYSLVSWRAAKILEAEFLARQTTTEATTTIPAMTFTGSPPRR
jgi:hypothetical protein